MGAQGPEGRVWAAAIGGWRLGGWRQLLSVAGRCSEAAPPARLLESPVALGVTLSKRKSQLPPFPLKVGLRRGGVRPGM